MSKKALIISTFALLMANFMGGLDETIINTALPSIMNDLDGVEELGLLTAMFLFSLAITTVIWGKIAEKIGAKKAFQISTSIFVVGSLFGGLAANIWVLIITRGIMGIGAGVMISIPFIIYAELYEDPIDRTKALGLVTASYSISIILGPVVGGWIVDLLSWHWTFFINIPIGLLSIFLIQFNFKEVKQLSQLKKKVDTLGTVMLVAILAVILFSIEYISQMNNLTRLLMAVIIVIGFVVFWQIEKRAEDPIVPNELLEDFPYVAKNLMMMLVSGLSIGFTVYAPMWAQSILGTSASLGGATQILSSFAIILATRMSPSLLRKISYKNSIWIGFVSIIISAIILAMATRESSYFIIVISGGFMGFGQGMAMPTLQVAMQNEVKPELLNIATTLSLLLRTITMSLMASVYGMMMTNNILSGVNNSNGQISLAMVNGLDGNSVQLYGINLVNQMRDILFSGMHTNFIIGLIAVIAAAAFNQFCWKKTGTLELK